MLDGFNTEYTDMLSYCRSDRVVVDTDTEKATQKSIIHQIELVLCSKDNLKYILDRN